MYAVVHVNLYDFHQYMEDAYVIFDTQILAVGPMSKYPAAKASIQESLTVIEGKGRLMMPGLVNAHHHLYSVFARGLQMAFNPKDFRELLEQLWWRLDKSLLIEDVYYSGVVGATDALKRGVTTIIDHHASGVISGSLNALKKSVCDLVGLRGIFCFETSNRFDLEACIHENLSFMASNQTQKSAGLFGLHASMTLNDSDLYAIGNELNQQPIHIHVAESLMDETDSCQKYHKRVVARLDDAGLLHKDALLVHGLYLDASEVELMAKKGCYVVFNPSSNMNNGVGLPDFQLYHDHQVPILLGNDGLSLGIINEWMQLYYAMHLKYQTPLGMTLNQVKDIIKAGYTYVSRRLNCQLGQIAPGFEADLLMIPYTPPTPIHRDNAFAHICFGLSDAFRPETVFVGGKPLVKGYRVSNTVFDTYALAKQHAKSLWKRV